MLLTTVVPVYNVEAFLRDGLDTLLGQNLPDGSHEVVLVDDGSSDSSGAICDEYARAHPGVFRVLHTPNRGVSTARNLGISEARGTYIHFMDPDDRIAHGAYGFLLDLFSDRKPDYIGFRGHIADMRHGAVNDPAAKMLPDKCSVIYDGDGYDLIKKAKVSTTVWNGLYRKSFLCSHSIGFDNDMAIAEDAEFNLRVMEHHPHAVVTNSTAYIYCMREGSAVRKNDRKRAAVWMASYLKYFATVNSLVSRDSTLMKPLRGCLDTAALNLTAKLLAIGIPRDEFARLSRTLTHMHTVPTTGEGAWLKFVNCLYGHPGLYPFMSFVYRNFFIPVVYPMILPIISR